jgi:3-oxoacyl-[acyl-carrier protein] reductase
MKMGLLQNKTVLITGSGRGIGAVLAEAFAREGASVVINYLRSKESATQLADRLSGQYDVPVLALQGDVTDSEQSKHLIDETVMMAGSIDILVNNALAAYSFDPERRKWAWEMDWDDYQKQIDGTLKGSFLMCKAVLPYMKRQNGGKIVNILTNLIHHPIVPYHDYTTAKTALLGFSRNLAADIGAFGINVNCIAPGLVYPTDASKPTKEEIRENLIAATPLRRIARPEDIAGSVLYLASPWSDFVTGQCLTVDGGYTMH